MKSVRDARGQGPIPVVPILPPRPSAPAWDCYSPVALVLWRAADFAEAGSYSPVCNAAIELGSPGYDERDRLSPWVMADELAYPNGRCGIAGASRREWAVALRQLAEFGPAGRPRVKEKANG